MESPSLIAAALAVLLILGKIILDELRRKRAQNGHNPNLQTLDAKLDLMAQANRSFHKQALSHLEKIRDAIERAR